MSDEPTQPIPEPTLPNPSEGLKTGRPEPTLPNPNVDIKTGEPVEAFPEGYPDRRAAVRKPRPFRHTYFRYQRHGVLYEYDLRAVVLAWLLFFLIGLSTGWVLFHH